tara:strand:- start:298 stop:489 length:192 start_codon:yes stop_codon:yes gene_type:complete
MPEYQALIRKKKGKCKSVKKRIFASCFSDAEKIAKNELAKGEYIHSLVNVDHPKDSFNVVRMR